MLAGMSFDEFAMSSLMTLRNNRGMGQVSTSHDLCREMISHIPTKVLKNPKSRFLDPCCGNGSFIIVLTEVLSKWHSPKQISKMVVGCDIDPTNIATAHIMIGDKYDIQLICCDSLEYNWDMKFDVVIGNPPYTLGKKQLYPAFIDVAFSLGTHVCMVCPLNLESTKKYQATFNMVKKHSTFISEDIRELYFPNVSASNIRYFIADKNVENEVTPPKEIDIPVLLPSHQRLIGSIRGQNKLSHATSRCDSGGIVYYHGVNKHGDVVTKHALADCVRQVTMSDARWLVLVQATVSGGNVNAAIVENDGTYWNDSLYVFEFNRKSDAMKLISWLKSNEFKSIIKNVMEQVGRWRLTKQILENLPSWNKL